MLILQIFQISCSDLIEIEEINSLRMIKKETED